MHATALRQGSALLSSVFFGCSAPVCGRAAPRPVDTTQDVRTMATSPTPTPAPSARVWSVPENGLSGRLRVEFEDLNPGLRYAVVLEVKNDTPYPIVVTNQPRVNPELVDSDGRRVDTWPMPMSGPIPAPQWAVIPRDSYAGFRVDERTVGMPTREHGKVLLALGHQTWTLTPGRYVLRAAAAFGTGDGAPQDPWVGTLALPAVEVVVMPDMVAAAKR